MKNFLSLGLVIVSFVAVCQPLTTWQTAADKYLKDVTAGEESFEEQDDREALRQILIAEFNKGVLDVNLSYLLATWSQEAYDTNAQHYFDQTIARLEAKDAYKRALFYLDFATFVADLKVEQLIGKAIEILHEIKKDSSIVIVRALEDLAAAQLRHSKYTQSWQSLANAMAIATRVIGMKSDTYVRLLRSASSYYAITRDHEKAAEFKKMSEDIESDYLGVNQPYKFLFTSESLPFFKTGEKNDVGADLYRTAALFQYPAWYTFRLAIASELYGEVVQQFSRRPGDELNYAAALTNKGVIDFALDPVGAVEVLQKATPLYLRRAQADNDMLLTLFNVANLEACAEMQLGKYTSANATFRQIENLFKRSSVNDWYQRVYHNMILASHGIGDRTTARDLLKKFHGNSYSYTSDFTQRYSLYGDILFGYGDYEDAFKIYDRARIQFWDDARQSAEKEEKPVGLDGNPIQLINTDRILLNIGPTESTNEIHPFKPTGPHYTRLLHKYAKAAFMMGKYSVARDAILEYINEYYTVIENNHMNYNRGSDLSEIYRLKKELFPAYDLFQNIIMVDSTTDQKTAAEGKMRAYMHVLDSKSNIQFEYRHIRSAIENGADESLKRALADYVAKRNELVRLRLSASSSPEQMESLKISVDTLASYMSRKTSLFELPSKKFVYWGAIQASLKEKEAAVEIRRFPKYDSGRWTNQVIYAAYVITRNSASPDVVFLKNGKYLEGRALKGYQNSIKSRLDDKMSYRTYWHAIQKLLPDISKIYLSSDGCYTQLNVNTLLNPDNGKYLIEELTIYNMVSTRFLPALNEVPGALKSAVLYGRPAYSFDDPKARNNPFDNDPDRAITRRQIADGKFVDLPGTEKEVMTIDRMLKSKGISVKRFLGRDATEEAFKQNPATIVHVATHGFWFNDTGASANADVMFNSGLLLAGVKNISSSQALQKEDGILTAYEIQGMDLDKTELVVLSACETAAGHVEAGEGVYGLQRAFTIAGADKLIMSLWKVDDDATQELFTTLYKEWLSVNPNLLDAFKKAQAAIRAKYQHPYYWGAFVLLD